MHYTFAMNKSLKVMIHVLCAIIGSKDHNSSVELILNHAAKSLKN
jgi:hypothetical protein